MSMSGGMGNMSTEDGVPDLYYLQKMFWAAVGAAIALAAVTNVYNKILCRQRYAAFFRWNEVS